MRRRQRALARRGRLTAGVLEQLILAQAVNGDIAGARAFAGEALAVWNTIAVDRTALIASILGQAEFRAGNVECAFELAQQSVDAARRLPRALGLLPSLLNLAAYAIACEHWEDALAASRDALRSAQETERRSCSAWALQHIAAAAVLSADAEPDRTWARDAALVIGFVDVRAAGLGSPREYTEEQEYGRVRTALEDALGPKQFEQFAAAGAGLSEARAAALALSLPAGGDAKQHAADKP